MGISKAIYTDHSARTREYIECLGIKTKPKQKELTPEKSIIKENEPKLEKNSLF